MPVFQRKVPRYCYNTGSIYCFHAVKQVLIWSENNQHGTPRLGGCYYNEDHKNQDTSSNYKQGVGNDAWKKLQWLPIFAPFLKHKMTISLFFSPSNDDRKMCPTFFFNVPYAVLVFRGKLFKLDVLLVSFSGKQNWPLKNCCRTTQGETKRNGLCRASYFLYASWNRQIVKLVSSFIHSN